MSCCSVHWLLRAPGSVRITLKRCRPFPFVPVVGGCGHSDALLGDVEILLVGDVELLLELGVELLLELGDRVGDLVGEAADGRRGGGRKERAEERALVEAQILKGSQKGWE